MLKERFFNTYKCSDHDNNEFILLLQKGVYPYKYMDDWKKLTETSLLEKKDFYSHLDMEDITDTGYMHANQSVKISKIKIQENIKICMFKAIFYCQLTYLRTVEICLMIFF